MKRVYLDWGVISNLKKPEFADIKEFLLSGKKGGLFFVYSPAHFEDAVRSEGDERLDRDIQMLEALVDNHLIAYHQKTAYPSLMTPTEYYRANKGRIVDSVPDISGVLSSISRVVPEVGSLLKPLMDTPFPVSQAARSQALINMMLPDLPPSPSVNDVIHSCGAFINRMLGNKDFYKSYRATVRASGFKLDANAGNWDTKEVIPNISEHLKTLGINKSFEDFVLSGFGDRDDVDTFQRIIAAYTLLDWIGYKSDKLPKASNAMNSVNTDARHTYYAAFCDYFITQDGRMADKAQALYSEYRVSTKVISPAEVIAELSENREEDLTSFLSEQLIEDHVKKRSDRVTLYKFDRRFLGVFSYCVLYEEDDYKLLDFRLSFDNYSWFLFIDEARVMLDRVTGYLGKSSLNKYEVKREKMIAGEPGAALYWQTEDIVFALCLDEERHWPELIMKITTHQDS